MADEFKGIGNETLKNVEALKSSMKEIAEATNKTNKSLREQTLLSADYASSFSKISSSASKFAELQDKAKRSASATSEAFKEQQKQLSVVRSLNAQIDNLYDQMLDANEKQEKVLKKQVNNLSAARDNAQELAKEFGDLVNDSSKLDKSTMWFSALSQVVTDIPGLRKLSSPFEAAAKASRETALNNAKNKAFLDEALETGKGLTKEKIKELGLEKEAGGLTGKAAAAKLKAAGVVAKTESVGIAGLQAGFKALGPIIKGVFAPLAIITTIIDVVKFFVDAMFEADKRAVEIGKNLSISKEAAGGIYENIKLVKLTTDDLRYNTENLTQAFNEIAGLTEFASVATESQLKTQVELTKILGLQVEEALALQSIFATNNIDAQEGVNMVYDQIAAFANQNKIVADGRKILKDVSNTSKTILLNFKGNVPELIKTTLEAKKLGLTLDQVDNIANSLLNFEESISSELNAELLLGRDINLEKARTAALNNDIATLTEEIAKQGITAENFSRLNRIQQEALAKTLGMNSKELGESLYKQELIKRTAGDYTKNLREQAQQLRDQRKDQEAIKLEKEAEAIEQGIIEGKSLRQAQERATAEERFNAALDRAKEIFSDLAKPGGLLDKVIDTLEDVVPAAEKGAVYATTGGIEEQSSKSRLEKAGYTVDEGEGLFGTGLLKYSTIKDKSGKEVDWAIGSTGLSEIAEIYSPSQEQLLEKYKEYKDWFEKSPPVVTHGNKFENSKSYQDLKEKFKANKMEFPPKGLQEGGIVPEGYPNDTFPARLSSNEAVVPLNEFYAKIDQLIMAVKSGRDIYIDSSKVTGALKITDYKSDYGTS